MRGHNECKTSDNRGNFLELLKLRGQDLPILNDDSIKFPYTSADIQNELIEILGSNIKTLISKEVQNRPFSIMDETYVSFTDF